MSSIADLATEVANTIKVTDSVVQFIHSLADQLAQANAGQNAAIDAIVTDLKANDQRLVDAITTSPATAPQPPAPPADPAQP